MVIDGWISVGTHLRNAQAVPLTDEHNAPTFAHERYRGAATRFAAGAVDGHMGAAAACGSGLVHLLRGEGSFDGTEPHG